jgi:hypothetical protein
MLYLHRAAPKYEIPHEPHARRGSLPPSGGLVGRPKEPPPAHVGAPLSGSSPLCAIVFGRNSATAVRLALQDPSSVRYHPRMRRGGRTLTIRRSPDARVNHLV